MSQSRQVPPSPRPVEASSATEEAGGDAAQLHGGTAWGFARPRPYYARMVLPGWRGCKRIAHLTDMHFGNVTPLALQRNAAALVIASRPDLTVLTGDFVARGLGHIEHLTDVLGAIPGRKVAVLGNHDWWSGADRVLRALAAGGVEVLSNRWTVDGTGEDALPIVCLDDQGTGHDDLELATRGLLHRPALALSHNPEAAPELWGRGATVVLSGHTHGGQFYIRRWTPGLYQNLLRVRFLNGFYVQEDVDLGPKLELGPPGGGPRLTSAVGQVYVNPGVGSSVLPWRYGRPAQRCVAIIDLEGGPFVPPEGSF